MIQRWNFPDREGFANTEYTKAFSGKICSREPSDNATFHRNRFHSVQVPFRGTTNHSNYRWGGCVPERTSQGLTKAPFLTLLKEKTSSAEQKDRTPRASSTVFFFSRYYPSGP